MKRKIRVAFGLVALTATPTPAQLHAQRQQGHFTFARQAAPLDEVSRRLQEFYDHGLDRAFRYAGDREDWFHGHFLYAAEGEVDAQGNMRPYAILYHTQENASSHSKIDPGGRYDYLDRGTRNWVQFLSRGSPRIFNAFELMRDCFPDTESFRSSLAATRSHYTVFDEQLDWRKFPPESRFRPVGTRQFDFDRVDCHADSTAPGDLFYALGRTEIRTREGDRLCLKITAPSAYMPRDDADGQGCVLKNDGRPLR